MDQEIEKKLKEKLLLSLIDKMDDMGSDRMKPKAVSVEVAAPDKEKLAEGLEKAREVIAHGDAPETEPDGDESDEDRLRALLGDDDDEDRI